MGAPAGMISGQVNLMRQPSITIALIDGDGRQRAIEARLDTGFSGDLTLPQIAIAQLGFPVATRSGHYTIGSGAMATFTAYEGKMQWRNDVRSIVVLESEILPVVGVGLLWGNNLSVDFVIGGAVAIRELPALGCNI